MKSLYVQCSSIKQEHRLTAPLIAGLLSLALLTASGLQATSPEAPISFFKAKDQWTLDIRFQVESFTDFYLKRSFLYFGQRISEKRQPLEVTADDEGISYQSFQFDSKLGSLDEGVYCQVIEVGARRLGREHGYVNRHHMYFEIVNDTVNPLSLREYSDLVNPLDFLPGPNGEWEVVHHGDVIRRQVPFSAVKAIPALQIYSTHDPKVGVEDSSEKNES